jgi:hypothetical protein
MTDSRTRRRWLQGAARIVSAALTSTASYGRSDSPSQAERADHRLEDETLMGHAMQPGRNYNRSKRGEDS